MTQPSPTERPAYLEELLARLLRGCFGALDDATLAELCERFAWVELPGGATLMRQGEPGDAMYVVLSGRLRAYVREESGRQRMVREMARGQIVGELALYSGEPRSATVIAIRDSVLMRLDASVFESMLVKSPQASVAMTRQLVTRLLHEQHRPLQDRPVTMGLLRVSEGVDAAGLAHGLARALERHGRVRVIDAAALDAYGGEPGLAQRGDDDAQASRRIAQLLDRLEADTEYLLLVGDATPSAWTGRCARHCDELLLLADATQQPRLHPIEERFLVNRPGPAEAAEILVLLHAESARTPSGTAAWLARRPVSDHVHVRPALARDIARLARLQSRTAVGLVCGGGGARGLAHLGVVRALQEQGIEVDCVGGTSIGAVMAALVASDQPLEQVMASARRAFARNPTGDFNPLPVLSVIRGQRLRRVLAEAEQALFGGPVDIEDLWKNTYCIVTNYSRACEMVVEHGALARSVLASTSIPGALPPVLHDGDLLCDGGTFNNFPVDVMQARRGVGCVIGVDLSTSQHKPIALPEMPGPLALALDRLRPRSRRRYRLPSLTAYLMNVTTLYSNSRRNDARAACGLYLNPPLGRVGMLDWQRFDGIVQQGYEHGLEMLRASPAPLLARLRGAAPAATA